MYKFISAALLLENEVVRHEAYVTRLHPLVIMLIGIAVGAFLLLILAAHFFSREKKKAQQQLDEVTGYFQNERLQTESILEDLGLGLMAFAPDGRLRIANKAMRDLLGEELPEQLDDFLSAYGEDNGLKASALLGAPVSRAELKLGKKIIALQLRESSAPGQGIIAKIVTAQDITREREEEQRRKNFVANVSHELKTPLTIIKTYSESLIDWGLDEKSKDAVKSDLERILDDVDRMENLISDLLLLSTLDAKGQTLRMTETDMAKLVRQVTEHCRLQAEEKNIHLNCYVMSSLPKAFVDRSSIDRVLLNIIQNAIKYTDNNGRIDVFVTQIWQDIVIKVKDNGKGIEEKHQKDIFERFFRVDNTGSRKLGGTGLGLAIAKELTELHHGKISVVSALTRGSEFSVTLPSAAKIYREVMLSLVQVEPRNQDAEDVLLREAEAELLEQAADLGMKAKSLRDLTRAEREKLMEPYKIQADEAEDEMSSEDFAGILKSDRRKEDKTKAQESPEKNGEKKTEAEKESASAETDIEISASSPAVTPASSASEASFESEASGSSPLSTKVSEEKTEQAGPEERQGTSAAESGSVPAKAAEASKAKRAAEKRKAAAAPAKAPKDEKPDEQRAAEKKKERKNTKETKENKQKEGIAAKGMKAESKDK